MIPYNPAISLALAFGFSLLVSFSTFEIYFLLPVMIVLKNQIKNIKSIFKKLIFLNVFILALFIVLLYEVGFDEAFNIYIRTNVIILFNLSLFHYSKGYDVVRGLYILKFPDAFISSTYFTIKMIETLTSDFKNIKTVLRSRGFRAKTNMFTYYTFGNVLGMLLVKSIRKAQTLKDSFISRGFRGKIYLNEEFNISRNDYYLIFSIVLLFIIKAIV